MDLAQTDFLSFDRFRAKTSGGELIRHAVEFPSGGIENDAEECKECTHLNKDFNADALFCCHPCRQQRSAFPDCAKSCPVKMGF